MEESGGLNSPETWLRMADEKLDHAVRIHQVSLHDDAISRAYYAMFYAAKGALLVAGVSLRKHSAVVTKFREIFVITGKVEAIYLRYLGRAQGARERSDYVPIHPASRAEAEEILEAAKKFIAKMKEVIEAGV